ncbi:MAG: hypothetical protein ACPG8W_14940 [Candidatus Promineifilaceae bacterium]
MSDSNEDAFSVKEPSYQIGRLYLTDDTNTLVHQYYTLDPKNKPDEQKTQGTSMPDADVAVYPNQLPVAIASTNSIKVGHTVISIQNAFAFFRYDDAKKELQVPVFIKELRALVTEHIPIIPQALKAQIQKEAVEKLFLIRLHGIGGGRIHGHIPLCLCSYIPDLSHSSDNPPSLATRLVNDVYGSNSRYIYRSTRPTIYLYGARQDRADIFYKLTVVSFESVGHDITYEQD